MIKVKIGDKGKSTPTVIGTKSLSAMMNFCQMLKIKSRKNCSQLIEDCAIVRHGSDLLVFYCFFDEIIITQEALRA